MKANKAPEKMKLIDKSALVAEIKNLIERAEAERVLLPKTILAAKDYLLIEDYKKLLAIINTLEVKEVDLNPTLEDISIIRQIMFDYNRQVRNEMSIPNDKEYCQEVLKRFKAQKGEEV